LRLFALLIRARIAPHPLYSSPDTRICLITADPPASDTKAYKTLTQAEQFPQDLKPKIRKIIAYSKLAKKYKPFESRRQLLSEYDVFLADERIIHLLPVALGSTFYKSTTKRPLPVPLTGRENYGKKSKKTGLDRLKPKRKHASNDGPHIIGKPADVGHDMKKALSNLVVNLSPSTSISVKVAYAGWPAEWITANVCAAVERVVTKYIPAQWDGLKAVHLKGPDTAALPLYHAEAIWDEELVLDEGEKAPRVRFVDEDGGKKKRKGKEISRVSEILPQISTGISEKRSKSKKQNEAKKKPQIESAEPKKPEKSKKRKKRKDDDDEILNEWKRTKVVASEPFQDLPPEEQRQKREAHEKLIEEVGRKIKELDKQTAIDKQKRLEEEIRKREDRARKAAEADKEKEKEKEGDAQDQARK
jgi:ribosome biogenesis protein UTP30